MAYPRKTFNISSATTTTLVSAVAGKIVKGFRFFASANGAQTIDLQDSAGNTLLGGPLGFVAGSNLYMDDDGTSPLFQAITGNGIQVVTTTSGAIVGFIDFIQA